MKFLSHLIIKLSHSLLLSHQQNLMERNSIKTVLSFQLAADFLKKY
jgi:hypothetical protein